MSTTKSNVFILYDSFPWTNQMDLFLRWVYCEIFLGILWFGLLIDTYLWVAACFFKLWHPLLPKYLEKMSYLHPHYAQTTADHSIIIHNVSLICYWPHRKPAESKASESSWKLISWALRFHPSANFPCIEE